MSTPGSPVEGMVNVVALFLATALIWAIVEPVPVTVEGLGFCVLSVGGVLVDWVALL